MRHVLGIDAGGTKTRALLADETGRVVGRGAGGGANLKTHGELEVEKVLHRVIEEAEAEAGTKPDAVALGIAGADRPEDHVVLRSILRRIGFRQRVLVTNDARIALVAGSPSRVGLALICGTGSIAWGQNAAGEIARAGGWGWQVGDEGSGFWIGLRAVRAALRASDGRGPSTDLVRPLLDHFEMTGVEDIVRVIYGGDFPRHRIALFAPRVAQTAAGGTRQLGKFSRRRRPSWPMPREASSGASAWRPEATISSCRGARSQPCPRWPRPSPRSFGRLRLRCGFSRTSPPQAPSYSRWKNSRDREVGSGVDPLNDWGQPSSAAGKRLIVNADDFGRTPGVNEGTIEAHLNGIVTSATVMVLEKAARDGIRQAIERAPRLGLGLHFMLTGGGVPGSAPASVPTLAPNGRLARNAELLPSSIPEVEVRRELLAQIALFELAAGRPPSHIDSHHHCALHPSVQPVVAAVASGRGLPLRAVTPQARDELRSSGLTVPDFFLRTFYAEGVTFEKLASLLFNVPHGSTELMCHPGHADALLLEGSTYGKEREKEVELLCDPAVKELIEKNSIELIGFGEL